MLAVDYSNMARTLLLYNSIIPSINVSQNSAPGDWSASSCESVGGRRGSGGVGVSLKSGSKVVDRSESASESIDPPGVSAVVAGG